MRRIKMMVWNYSKGETYVNKGEDKYYDGKVLHCENVFFVLKRTLTEVFIPRLYLRIDPQIIILTTCWLLLKISFCLCQIQTSCGL